MRLRVRDGVELAYDVYNHYLKGMDSGVLEGPPINLWIQGGETWRGEREWPLARTNLFLAGHRLRLEIASCDPAANLIYTHEPMPRVVTNTIETGQGGLRLLVPFIPR